MKEKRFELSGIEKFEGMYTRKYNDNWYNLPKEALAFRAPRPGVQYVFSFPYNHYGASVIKHPGSYGYEDDEWELAVMYEGHITYDTEITQDVEGYLDDGDVVEFLEMIQALPPVGEKRTLKEAFEKLEKVVADLKKELGV